MKRAPLSEVKDSLSKYLRLVEEEEIVITRHGKPAGILKASAMKMTGSTTNSSATRGS